MRSFVMTLGQTVFTLSMYCIAIVCFGIALMPGLYLYFTVYQVTASTVLLWRCFFLGLTVAAGFFLFGFSLIFLAGTIRMGFRLRLKEGTHRMFSLQALKWAFMGCLYLLIYYTFIDFLLLTPFANILLRMLGVRLGRNVQINSKFIFDASLLEIGDGTVIGGDSVIQCHSVERGLIIETEKSTHRQECYHWCSFDYYARLYDW